MTSAIIIAAEASSVPYAKNILDYYQKQNARGPSTLQFFGIGSRQMEAIGFECLGRSEELAVVGFSEVIAHYDKIKETFDKIIIEAEKRKPRFALLMDYPGFNLKLMKRLKDMGIPCVYYISPQIWAWKKGRIKAIKKYCDKMLVVFPFEKEFYEKQGVPVEFVGHPLLEEMGDEYFDDSIRQVHRGRFGFSERDVVLGLMPGSRKLEVKYHFQTQLKVAQKLSLKYPNLKVAVLVAPNFEKTELQEYISEQSGLSVVFIKDEPFRMIQVTDLILAASGTATLMVGLLEKPMVVMYRMSWITALLARLLVRGIKYFCIVNLIMGREVVPERFQGAASPDELERLIQMYLDSPESIQSVKAELKSLKSILGEKGATRKVFDALKSYLA